MVHVSVRGFDFFFGEDFFHPTWVQINEVTDAAAVIGEVLDGQAEPAGTSGAYHQPGAAAGEMCVGDFGGELFIVRFVIIPADALLGHAGGATGFENIEGAALVFFGHPNFRLKVAQPFVLKMRKAQHVAESLYLFDRVPSCLAGPIEPEGAAGFG